MISLGALFKDTDAAPEPEEKETKPEPIKVFAGAVNSRLLWRDPSIPFEDFETPSFVPNPHYVPSEKDLEEPYDRKCPRCGEFYLFEPTMIRSRVVLEIGRPCEKCDSERKIYKLPLHTDKTPITCPTPHPIKFIPMPPSIIRNECVSTERPASSLGPQGHAKHGPSSLKPKEICPHYKNSSGTNPVAEEGTMLHERLQMGDVSGLKDEQRVAVEMVANVFNAAARELAASGTTVIEMVERRVNVAEETWGTADLILMSQDGKRAKVCDAKFGWNPVEDAEVNLQGWAYAVGVFYEFPTVEEIEVIFAQPRCDELSRHTFTRAADYNRMLVRIQTVIARAEDPNAPYNADAGNCTWCANKASCPTLHKLALLVAPTVELESAFAVPPHLDPKTMEDPNTVSQARKIADLLENWIEAVKARATELAKEGVDIPGWRLMSKSVPREITNPGAALGIAMTDYGLTLEDILPTIKRVSVPDLETAVAAKAKRGEKQQLKQKFEDSLRDVDAIRADGEVLYLKREKKQQTTPALN